MGPETERFSRRDFDAIDHSGRGAKVVNLPGGEPPVAGIVIRIPQLPLVPGNDRLVPQRIALGKLLDPTAASIVQAASQ